MNKFNSRIEAVYVKDNVDNTDIELEDKSKIRMRINNPSGMCVLNKAFVNLPNYYLYKGVLFEKDVVGNIFLIPTKSMYNSELNIVTQQGSTSHSARIHPGKSILDFIRPILTKHGMVGDEKSYVFDLEPANIDSRYFGYKLVLSIKKP